MCYCQVERADAEQIAAADRAAILLFRDMTPQQAARLLSFGVRPARLLRQAAVVATGQAPRITPATPWPASCQRYQIGADCMRTMVCLWCHANNPSTEKYCKSCNHEIAQTRQFCSCPECNAVRTKMMSANVNECTANIAGMGQLSLATSLLAGFAFTAAMTLLGLKEQDGLHTCTQAFFLLSALLLLSSTCTFVFMSSAASEELVLIRSPSVAMVAWQAYKRKRNSFMSMGVLLFGLGLLGFLIGVAISGWLFSTLIGIISAGAGFLALILVLCAFFISISEFHVSIEDVDKAIHPQHPALIQKPE
jgi:hypothetical protein